MSVSKRAGGIRYFAMPNKLNTPNAPAFLPRVVQAGSVGQEQVLDFITQEGTTITRAEGLAVFNGVAKALAHFLSLGYSVKLPFADFRPTVQGRIDSQEAALSSTALQASIRVSVGPAIRKTLNDVPLLAVDQKAQALKIFKFQNMRDQAETSLQSGDLCVIKGQRLAFDPSIPEDGVFFVSSTDSTEVRAPDYSQTGNRSTTFKAPPLSAGTWNLIVRSGMTNGKRLSGSLAGSLQVS